MVSSQKRFVFPQTQIKSHNSSCTIVKDMLYGILNVVRKHFL